MATPQIQQQNSLQIRRTFAAPRERVFRAWIDAREFAQWFHPTTDHTTVVSQLDPKVGGKYQIEIQHKSGKVHKMTGRYEQIKPPEKLSFTWSWASDPTATETLVSLEFLDLGNATEIVLTHGQFPTTEDRDNHNAGWLGCLDQLQNFLT